MEASLSIYLLSVCLNFDILGHKLLFGKEREKNPKFQKSKISVLLLYI